MRSCNYSSIIPSPLACKMFSKCLLTILEWNWYERLGDGKNNWSKICHQVLTSSTQVKLNQVISRREKNEENGKRSRKACKAAVFVVKCANLSLSCRRHRHGCEAPNCQTVFERRRVKLCGGKCCQRNMIASYCCPIYSKILQLLKTWVDFNSIKLRTKILRFP